MVIGISDYGTNCLFRTAVRSVMRGVIKEESSNINLVNGLSVAWILGSGIFLELVTEA